MSNILAKAVLIVAGIAAILSTIDAQTILSDGPRLGVQVVGVVVEEVDQGSVADKGGLKVGDIITQWNDDNPSDLAHLAALVDDITGPTSVALTVMRGGRPVFLRLNFTKESLADPEKPRLGIAPVRGVRIDSVIEGSVAEKSGIEDDDIILSWNGEPLISHEDLVAHVGQIASGGETTLDVRRKNSIVKINVRFPSLAKSKPRDLAVPGPRQSPLDLKRWMEPVTAFGELGSVEEMLARAIATLEGEKRTAGIESVLGLLKSARDKVAKVAGVATKVKQLRDELSRKLADGGIMIDDMSTEFEDLRAPEADSAVVDRVTELLDGGMPVEKLNKVLAEEFPDFEAVIVDEVGSAHPGDPTSAHRRVVIQRREAAPKDAARPEKTKARTTEAKSSTTAEKSATAESPASRPTKRTREMPTSAPSK